MSRTFLILLVASLVACTTPQPQVVMTDPEVAAEPLPVCQPPAVVDEPAPQDPQPALHEAYNLYVSGNLEAAMLAYERILARAEQPEDQLNALIALGLIRLMPSSQLQDFEAASLILDEISKRVGGSDLYYAYFGQAELLRQIQSYQQRIANLHASNGALKAELAGKDEAIRKLRELTVGSNLSP